MDPGIIERLKASA